MINKDTYFECDEYLILEKQYLNIISLELSQEIGGQGWFFYKLIKYTISSPKVYN